MATLRWLDRRRKVFSVPEYALLIAPSANRVYSGAAAALTLAELAVFNERMLGWRLRDARVAEMGSVEYVVFGADDLGPRERALLSNLSSLYALFALHDGRLEPLELQRLDRFGSDLVTIQKYAGKTNEAFTKLLLNVTMASTQFAAELPNRRLSVLDPLCGRGTTLNQALTYGYSVAGVEIDRKDFDAYAAFIQRWVKDKRLKHQAQVGHVRGHRRLALEIGLDKASYKEGKKLHLSVVNANTLETTAVYPPRSFDVIATDAPYGVQHGSSGAQGDLSRSPLDLLRAAAPFWREVLRPGGALGIAWNTLVAKRELVEEILRQSGLEVCDAPCYQGFKHRVDQSILRDVIVATRTS